MRHLAPIALVLVLVLLGCDTVQPLADAGPPDAGEQPSDSGPPDTGTDAGPPPPSCVIQLSGHELDAVPYCPASEAYIAAALAPADGGTGDAGVDGGAGLTRLDVLETCGSWDLCEVGDPPCYHCEAWAPDPR